jgi:tetratricopeptide (TPR) repeat protein
MAGPKIARVLPLAVVVAVGCGGPETIRIIDGKPRATRYVTPSAYEHYLRARIHRERGNLRAAEQQLRAALLFDDQSPYLYAELGQVLLGLGHASQAAQQASKALSLDRTSPEALILAGDVALGQNRPEDAIEAYQRCNRAHPAMATGFLRLGQLYNKTSRPRQARAVLERFAKGHRHPLVDRLLGLTCLRQLDFTCAKRSYALALRQQTTICTLRRLATIARAQGDFEHAVRLLREAFDKSGSPRLAPELFAAFLGAEDRRGLEDFAAVLARQLQHKPTALATVASELTQRGVSKLAIRLLQKHESKSPAMRIALAEALLARDPRPSGKAAKRAFRLLRKERKGRHAAWAALVGARALLRANRAIEVAGWLAPVLARNKRNAGLIGALSEALFAAGKHKQSVAVAAGALAAHDDPQLALHYALALARTGQQQKALEQAEKVIKRHPQNAAAFNFIGFLVADQTTAPNSTQLARAEKAIRRALWLDPAAAYAIDSFGWLQHKKGLRARALVTLTMAHRLAPQEPEIAAHLGAVNAALGHVVKAMRLYERAISHGANQKLVARWRAALGRLKRGRLGKRQK